MRRPFTALTAMTLACGAFAAVAIVGGCAFDWGLPSADPPDGAGEGSAESSIPPDAFRDTSTLDTSLPPSRSCKSNADCNADSYCRFPDHLCGQGAEGTCELAVLTGCVQPAWVCGCLGVPYKHLCDAATKRDDVSAAGTCTPPSLMFRCGTRLCDESKTFCHASQKGGLVEYDCVDFAGCAAADCTCATVTKLACSVCDDAKVGQVLVKCP